MFEVVVGAWDTFGTFGTGRTRRSLVESLGAVLFFSLPAWSRLDLGVGGGWLGQDGFCGFGGMLAEAWSKGVGGMCIGAAHKEGRSRRG